MAYQSVFRRYEIKYLLTEVQRQELLLAMSPHMALDRYGKTTIRNLYFDTDSYRLIRRSIEKPIYKEKLRLRSYSQADADTSVFVELKKKYQSVVYKRRTSMTEREAIEWLCHRHAPPNPSQITNEIDYFLDYYGNLHPAIFLSYEREAFYMRDGSDFRVTFDQNILARNTDLSLTADVGGTALLPQDRVLMEIKCSGSIPLWMTAALSKQHIYKTSFSKYGFAYQNMLYPQKKEKLIYVY